MPYCISNDELAILVEITSNECKHVGPEIRNFIYFALQELQRARKKLKEYQDAKGME